MKYIQWMILWDQSYTPYISWKHRDATVVPLAKHDGPTMGSALVGSLPTPNF